MRQDRLPTATKSRLATQGTNHAPGKATKIGGSKALIRSLVEELRSVVCLANETMAEGIILHDKGCSGAGSVTGEVVH
jgi:hypothetical protein